jgi:N-acyl-D-amino-acid deacylase
VAATLARLHDPQACEAMSRDVKQGLPGWENLYRSCGPQGIVIAHAAAGRAEDVGKTLAMIGEERCCDPFVAALDLLRDVHGRQHGRSSGTSNRLPSCHVVPGT